MRWTIKPKPESEKIATLAKELQVSPLIATLLLQRGITTFNDAKTFFRPSLNKLHDPFLMKDMDVAVERILQAIKNQENILVYGDYDVDGTTAVALMSSYLRSFYGNVATYIPDRYDEGYGVSFKGIDFAADNNFSLIIALDCGVKALEKVAYAKQKGIDFIICDHHKPGKELPGAVAVLDPKREDCNYPYKELCGCGVGFKLVQALANVRNQSFKELEGYLDLVATAIGADIVPITGENRVLMFYGLKQINTNPRPGIAAIINKQLRKKKKFNVSDVVFIIAPRINAAGRIKHGEYAVQLLTAENNEKAKQYADEIEKYNTERKGLDQEITKEALKQIKENKEEDKFSTVVYNPSWHKGVIGIVASKLTETYYRPTVVFTKSNGKLTASARSVAGFNVYEALEACSDCIEQFGGHDFAAGLTLLEENFEIFKEKFESVVKQTIDPKLLTPEIKVDAEVNLSELTPKTHRILKQFAPFGPGNYAPVFLSRNLKDTGYARPVGKENEHLKCKITQLNQNIEIDGIGFNLAHKINILKNNNLFSAVYSLDENEWNGKVSAQLKLKDIM